MEIKRAMEKELILLTNAFPYGEWEPYLESEASYYEKFDRVLICALQTRKEQLKHKRQIPQKYQVIPIIKASNITYIINVFSALIDKNFYYEVYELIKSRRFSIKRLIRLLIYLSRSHYESKKIIRFFVRHEIIDCSKNCIVYSYRFEYQPYVGLLLKKYFPWLKVVSRGHGYDLYEERNSDSYIPMRKVLLTQLNCIYMISEDGKKYLEKKYPDVNANIEISRLGTIGYSFNSDFCDENVCGNNKSFKIVSCSNVVPLKRVELIAQCLKQINDVEILWTHYGDGPLLHEVKKYSERELPNNIRFCFKGNIPNNQLLKEYAEERYQLFINVSSAEGVPVSIMEAMSFGIPCVATDVGGTSEILHDNKEGLLLKQDFTTDELATIIKKFAQMPMGEYMKFSHAARDNWEKCCDANYNYRLFVDGLLSELEKQ